MAASVFHARLSEANLVTKIDFDNKIISLYIKIFVKRTKNESIENELKKLKWFDSSYFIGKSHFEEDDIQNYLAFQPIHRYVKLIANTIHIHHGNPKDYLMKVLNPLLHLITVFLL